MLGRLARSRRFYYFQAMSEEQLKAAEAEATAQVEEGVEEISEEDLAGVAGGFAGQPYTVTAVGQSQPSVGQSQPYSIT